jgi:hypothetical protein
VRANDELTWQPALADCGFGEGAVANSTGVLARSSTASVAWS